MLINFGVEVPFNELAGPQQKTKQGTNDVPQLLLRPLGGKLHFRDSQTGIAGRSRIRDRQLRDARDHNMEYSKDPLWASWIIVTAPGVAWEFQL